MADTAAPQEIVSIEQMWGCLERNPDILPVRLSTIAPMMGMTEDQCAKAFIEYATRDHGPVTFRYPPLPCAAIMKVGH